MMRSWAWVVTMTPCALFALTGRALAQECASDEDCAASYTCEVTAASGCGFACPEGAEPCEPPADFACESMEYRSCVPGPCSSDADCEEGMVCYEQESWQCPASTAVDCPPEADCALPEPEPEPCTSTTRATCVPRYVPPCERDADCGDGFRCVEQTIGSCSSAPASGSDAAPSNGFAPPPESDPVPVPPEGSEPLPPEPECTSEGTGTFYCEVVEVACDSDADCASGWTCGDNPSRPVCGGTARPAPAAEDCGGAVPALCRLCENGECGKPVCLNGAYTFVCPEDDVDGGSADPSDTDSVDCGGADLPEKLCIPPFSELGWAAGGSVAFDTASQGVPSEAPRAEAGEPANPGDGDDRAPDGTARGKDGGLCTVGRPGAARGGTASILGLLLALAFVWRRPRARQITRR